MRNYRICSLDVQGHIFYAFELACRDDLDALAEGERLSDDSAVEVWDGSRLVARVKPGNASLTVQDSYSL
jgi:VCBS repeat-containing protein